MQKKHITMEKLKEQIQANLPRIIFLLGKTCTGKSTFARELKEFGYEHVELDFVVRKNVRDKFQINDSEAFTVYKGAVNIDWQKSFESAANDFIVEKAKRNRIVVDAAIADPKVLERILSNDANYFFLIHFHPFDREFYYISILNRFTDDLNKKQISFPIWELVTDEVLSDFHENGENGKKVAKIIREYCDDSIEKSITRFDSFKKTYPTIILTGH